MAAGISQKFEAFVTDGPKHKSNTPKQRAPQSGPKQEIAFVNLTDSSGPIQDAQKRKLVRAHVMREYQRQKQAQEAGGFDRFQQHQYVDGKEPFARIAPMPQQESITANPDLAFSPPLEAVDWVATPDVRLNQYESEAGRVFEQVEGEWLPEGGSGIYGGVPAMPDMTYYIGSGNYDLNLDQSVHTDEDMDYMALDDPFRFLQQPTMFPEEIECPLVSRSLTLTLSFNTLNSGMLDPFNAIPGLKNARAQALMYHYNKVLVNTLIPVNPKDKWFSYAISDEALFHATMLHSAGHNAMLTGNNDLADPFQLKLEAIRLVNRRLGDPLRSISDLTIGAVACLVLFENQAGNVEVSTIHMEGLHRMIALRGGLKNLGLSGILQRKVLWADVCNAMISLSKPRYNLQQAAITLAIGPVTDSMTTYYAPQSDILISPAPCSCDRYLTEIIIDLRKLSDKPPMNALDGSITDQLYLVERRLVTRLNPSNKAHHSPSCQSLIRPPFIAAVIYIYSCLRDFPLQAPLFDAFVARLSGALFEDPAQAWERSGYSMLHWVLAMGSMAASGRADRCRFIAELEGISGALDVRTFENFENTLRRIVWNGRSADALKSVWGDILEVRQG